MFCKMPLGLPNLTKNETVVYIYMYIYNYNHCNSICHKKYIFFHIVIL